MTSRFPARTTSNPSVSSWGKPASGGIGVVNGYGVATGGTSSTITVGGLSYTLLTFTSSSTLTVTASGLFDVGIIGGGGSGGGRNTTQYGGAGGGGAGLIINTLYLTGNQTVTIGAGATGVGGGDGNVGSTTRVGDIVALGGGFGVSLSGRFSSFAVGSAGGSGGGIATTGQGSGGGDFGTPVTAGPGGGGFSAVGGNGQANGGNGGAGYDISAFISGASYFVCAGGGGGAFTGTVGAAGSTGAGTGGKTGVAATSATQYGSGGGGRGDTGNTGAGFQGVVYVRFRI
jgi:hypothetical protein